MKEELEKKLVDAFPNFYKDYHGDMETTCMAWGMECGDGWFDLIWELSEKIEKLINEYVEANPADTYVPRASQIKEKFGGLRVYMNSETDEMTKIVDYIEEKSYTICERCGEKGTLRKEGWMVTLCDLCNKK